MEKNFKTDDYLKVVNPSDLGKAVFERIDYKPGMDIFVVGCGAGRNCKILKEEYAPEANIVATDYNEEFVKAASKVLNPIGVKTYPADVTNYDISKEPFDKKYDVVTSVSVLHWVHDAEAAVQNINKVLKKDGQFITEFASESPPLIRKAVVESMKEMGFQEEEVLKLDGWRRTPKEEYNQILTRNGFKDIKIDDVYRYQPLEDIDGPDSGMKNWINKFMGSNFLSVLDDKAKEQVIEMSVTKLKDTELYQDGKWKARYQRMKISASKEREIDIKPDNTIDQSSRKGLGSDKGRSA